MEDINQKIIELFVEREILADVTDMVEYVFDTATKGNCPPFDPDSVEMLGSGFCPECGANAEYQDFHTVTLEEVIPILDYEAEPGEEYKCPHCGLGYPTKEEAKACCAGEEIVVCLNCGHTMPVDEYLELAEVDVGDITQWVLVTPWLASKLEEQGEILIRDKNIWGRVESAVEFADEDAIIQICNDAEILEGQAHDWSKRLCS